MHSDWAHRFDLRSIHQRFSFPTTHKHFELTSSRPARSAGSSAQLSANLAAIVNAVIAELRVEHLSSSAHFSAACGMFALSELLQRERESSSHLKKIEIKPEC